jgi:Rieske Fe-S protein
VSLESFMAEDKETLSRRGFIKIINQLLVASGLAALIGPVVAYFWPAELEEFPTEPKAVGPRDSISVGESVTIPFGRHPALVIRVTEADYVVYSAVCTHFACLVAWNPESGLIECPCHEGYFDPIDGSVIEGPPPEGLLPLHHFFEEDILFIGGEA